MVRRCNVAFVGFRFLRVFFALRSNIAALGEDFFFFSSFPPTVLFTLGRYWHRQVSSQLCLHHALYMRSSQTDERERGREWEREVAGEKGVCEGMGEKRERGVGNREARGALDVREEGRRLGKVGGSERS